MLGGRCAPSHLDAAPGVGGWRLLPLFREGNPEIWCKRCQPGAGWVVWARGGLSTWKRPQGPSCRGRRCEEPRAGGETRSGCSREAGPGEAWLLAAHPVLPQTRGRVLGGGPAPLLQDPGRD